MVNSNEFFGLSTRVAEDLDQMYAPVSNRYRQKPSTISLGEYDIIQDTNSYTMGSIHLSISGFVNHHGQLLKASDLYALYRDKGISFINDIDGAFILTLIDKDTIYMARDAAGRRTAYYHQNENNELFFAPQPKCIYSLSGFKKELKESSLYKYLTFSFVPGRDTMLKGIYELRPGEIITYKNKQLTSRFYFDAGNITKVEKSKTEWITELRTEIDEQIQLAYRANQNIGCFLSGGLDSSIITSRAALLQQEKVPTYSIHFGSKYPSELEFASQIATKYNTDHHEVLIEPKQFVSNFEELMGSLDEPIGDPITIPNYLLAKTASKSCDGILNGEGGDPCFGGPKNFEMLLSQWYPKTTPQPYSLEKTYLASYRRGYAYLDFLLNKGFNAHHRKKNTLEQVLSPYFENDTLNFLDQLMVINIREKGAHLILPKVERMLSYAGINSCSPMFSKKVIELSLQMPSQYKLGRGNEKLILKWAYENEIPKSIIERPKSGMRVPIHYWFKGDMKKYAKKTLMSPDFLNLGYFDKEGIKKLLSYDTEEGLKRHGLLTWMLLTFAAWHKNVFGS